ncbi:hypothetical protein VPH35_002558 [Triticum aestivum]
MSPPATSTPRPALAPFFSVISFRFSFPVLTRSSVVVCLQGTRRTSSDAMDGLELVPIASLLSWNLQPHPASVSPGYARARGRGRAPCLVSILWIRMPSAARRRPRGFCAPPSSLPRRWSSIPMPRLAGSRRPSPFRPVLAGALAGLRAIAGLPCILHRAGEERTQPAPPLACVDRSAAMACLFASIRPNSPTRPPAPDRTKAELRPSVPPLHRFGPGPLGEATPQRPTFYFFSVGLVSVSAHIVFFPVCEIYLLSRVCLFYRLDPILHAYNNSQTMYYTLQLYI